MHVVVRGRELPGRPSAGQAGSRYENVYVALQVGRDPLGLVRADADHAEWRTEVSVVERDGETDYRGPAVQGRRGERFLYLTWGTVTGDTFEMFRRAKLMLAGLPRQPSTGTHLVADVSLTDAKGQPRCARVDPPDLTWSWEAGAGLSAPQSDV